jgi:hypothetical protein
MDCTLDETVIDIEELVRQPFKRRPGMRTAVLVGCQDRVFAHHKEPQRLILTDIDVKASGTRIRDFVERT